MGKENYTRVTERSLQRRISQKWGWHKVCTPLLTHEWETYMALQENIYGRQRECIWNIYGTQATVNSRTRDGSLDSPPWWGNCDDRCGDNNAPVLIVGGADWRKVISSPKKRTLGSDTKIVPRPKWKFERFNLETETAFYINRHLFWTIVIKEQILDNFLVELFWVTLGQV